MEKLEKKVAKKQKMAITVRNRFRWLEGRDPRPICAVESCCFAFPLASWLELFYQPGPFLLMRSTLFPLTGVDVRSNLFLSWDLQSMTCLKVLKVRSQGQKRKRPSPVMCSFDFWSSSILHYCMWEHEGRGLKKGLGVGLTDWLSQSGISVSLQTNRTEGNLPSKIDMSMFALVHRRYACKSRSGFPNPVQGRYLIVFAVRGVVGPLKCKARNLVERSRNSFFQDMQYQVSCTKRTDCVHPVELSYHVEERFAWWSPGNWFRSMGNLVSGQDRYLDKYVLARSANTIWAIESTCSRW